MRTLRLLFSLFATVSLTACSAQLTQLLRLGPAWLRQATIPVRAIRVLAGKMQAEIFGCSVEAGWHLEPSRTISTYWADNSGIFWLFGGNCSGAAGVSSATNYSSARYQSAFWLDADGHKWIFRGFGYDSVGDSGVLNDFWELP